MKYVVNLKETDGVMNEFVSSLHPPSFHRNDFSTCSTHFSFILPQDVFFAQRAHVDFMHAHAHAENLQCARTRKWRRSVSAGAEPHDLP